MERAITEENEIRRQTSSKLDLFIFADKLRNRDDNKVKEFIEIYNELEKIERRIEYINDVGEINNPSNSFVGKFIKGLTRVMMTSEGKNGIEDYAEELKILCEKRDNLRERLIEAKKGMELVSN